MTLAEAIRLVEGRMKQALVTVGGPPTCLLELVMVLEAAKAAQALITLVTSKLTGATAQDILSVLTAMGAAQESCTIEEGNDYCVKHHTFH